MEARVIKRITGWRLIVGGKDHEGWLPALAARPEPTPIRALTLDLEIRYDGHGWFLEYHSDDPGFNGDTWHQSLEEAEQQAQTQFAIEPSQWEDATP